MEPRDILILEIIVGSIITLVTTIFYGVFAPWYKESAGRYIFGLLCALTLVLGNTVLRIFLPGMDPERIGSIVLFALYVIAMSFVGHGIYNAQIGRYKRKLFIKREKERHRQL